MSDGRKHDTNKSPCWQGVLQYFPRAVLAIGNVSGYGADKYDLSFDDQNFARTPRGYERYSDALVRHLIGEFTEGPIDRESGLAHAALAAWNALARLELYLRKLEDGSGH